MGCGSLMNRYQGAERPPVEANLLVQCPELTLLESKTGKALTEKLKDVGKAYNLCKDGKQALIEAVK